MCSYFLAHNAPGQWRRRPKANSMYRFLASEHRALIQPEKKSEASLSGRKRTFGYEKALKMHVADVNFVSFSV